MVFRFLIVLCMSLCLCCKSDGFNEKRSDCVQFWRNKVIYDVDLKHNLCFAHSGSSGSLTHIPCSDSLTTEAKLYLKRLAEKE